MLPERNYNLVLNIHEQQLLSNYSRTAVNVVAATAEFRMIEHNLVFILAFANICCLTWFYADTLAPIGTQVLVGISSAMSFLVIVYFVASNAHSVHDTLPMVCQFISLMFNGACCCLFSSMRPHNPV